MPFSWNGILSNPRFWSTYLVLCFEDDEAREAILDMPLGELPSDIDNEGLDLHRELEARRVPPADDPDSLAWVEERLKSGPADVNVSVRDAMLRNRALQNNPLEPRRAAFRFPEGWEWRIEFAAPPDHQGIYHFLVGPGDPAVLLGHVSGHQALPILRFAEMVMISDHAASHGQGDFEMKYVPLLLGAVTSVAQAERKEAARWTEAAWRRAEIVTDPKSIKRIARELTAPIGDTWREDPSLGWVTDAEVSYRNPNAYADAPELREGFDQGRGFEQIAKFMRAVANH
jgi:hypothetical protein